MKAVEKHRRDDSHDDTGGGAEASDQPSENQVDLRKRLRHRAERDEDSEVPFLLDHEERDVRDDVQSRDDDDESNRREDDGLLQAPHEEEAAIQLPPRPDAA